MKIVTVPHAALRKKAKPVETLDTRMIALLTSLSKALLEGPDFGVGLAAPQINKNIRAFVVKQHILDETKDPRTVRYIINPRITKASKTVGLGKDPDGGVPLEGCLSIPGIFGPVPRAQSVTVSFDTLLSDSKPTHDPRLATSLQTESITVSDFAARLFQHEIDHLDGILYTDYTLEYDLPLYKETHRGELEAITDKRFITGF